METWGRGIEKICESCKKYGVPIPEYILHLEDIMVKFIPLNPSKMPKGENGTLSGTLNGTLEDKVLSVIREKPNLTQPQIAILIGSSERSTKRLMKKMLENGKIERVGGRKQGYWKEKTD